VETIGDAYLVVSGLPTVYDRHAQEMSLLALELLDSVTQHVIPHLPEYQLQIRVGLHSGKSESTTSYQAPRGQMFPRKRAHRKGGGRKNIKVEGEDMVWETNREGRRCDRMQVKKQKDAWEGRRKEELRKRMGVLRTVRRKGRAFEKEGQKGTFIKHLSWLKTATRFTRPIPRTKILFFYQLLFKSLPGSSPYK